MKWIMHLWNSFNAWLDDESDAEMTPQQLAQMNEIDSFEGWM